jgi:hypothetical protein
MEKMIQSLLLKAPIAKRSASLALESCSFSLEDGVDVDNETCATKTIVSTKPIGSFCEYLDCFCVGIDKEHIQAVHSILWREESECLQEDGKRGLKLATITIQLMHTVVFVYMEKQRMLSILLCARVFSDKNLFALEIWEITLLDE